MKTNDKVLLSVLAVVFVGMMGAFIAAVDNGNSGSHLSQAVLSGEASYALENEADDTNEPADVPIIGNALEKASSVAHTCNTM